MCHIWPGSLLSLPFQFIYAAVRLFPVFIVSMSFPCSGCFCLIPSRSSFSASHCIPSSSPAVLCLQLPLHSTHKAPPSQRGQAPLCTPFSSQCYSSHFALLLCLKYSLSSTSLSEAFSRPSFELQVLVFVFCFYSSHCSFLLLLSINIHRGQLNICSSYVIGHLNI